MLLEYQSAQHHKNFALLNNCPVMPVTIEIALPLYFRLCHLGTVPTNFPQRIINLQPMPNVAQCYSSRPVSLVEVGDSYAFPN